MRLRHALDDYKRNRDHGTRFPGERRSTNGLFSGTDGRLVHVSPAGGLRDYSYPLLDLFGIGRSRFGIVADETEWFDDGGDQRYVGDTALVETSHRFDGWGVTQYDLTVGAAHITRFELSGDPPAGARLRGVVAFAPDGQEGQTANLDHGEAVEVYHRHEHDYLGASTDLSAVDGGVPERLDELLSTEPVDFPRPTAGDSYEATALSGTVGFEGAFVAGGVTVVTLLTAGADIDRGTALDRLRELAGTYDDAAALRAAAAERAPVLDEELPARDAVVADLRVLAMLAASSGARIAGPDFDPLYVNSGGYGYTWFRDDAEIGRFLMGVDERLGLGLGEWHDRSAAFYCQTQLDDGTWPHRVWPREGTLAPGWANARIEAGDGADYQADQTASVVAFLADYLRRQGGSGDVSETLAEGVAALDETLAADGLPVASQNAWENMLGRFTHTAAAFLHAYAAVARAPVDDELAEHARSQADRVHGALADLWTGTHYALRLHEGDLDERLDSSTLALVAAHREYATVADRPGDTRDRLVQHVERTVDGLSRDTGAIRGLIRFADDPWRRRSQAAPKIWTVSTAWGANATAQLGTLLAAAGDERSANAYDRSRDLLSALLPGGPLARPGGYLPEQLFDDGTPDCATPLGWPHALRLATVTHLDEAGELDAGAAAARTD